jgi:hypothetical protein
MAGLTREGGLSYPAGADIEAGRRLKLVSGVWQLCGATDPHQAISAHKAGSGAMLTGLLWNAVGTFRLCAAGAVNAEDDIYGAANGKISTTNTGYYYGQALEDASGDGALIECLAMPRALA